VGEKEKQEKHIARIKGAVTHMTDLLNDVLSISKLEEGKISLSPEEFEFSEFINSVLQEIKPITKEGQQITYDHKGKNAVRTDKKILRNLLFNLVSNAIKFSSEGKEINVISEIDEDEIRLSVKDHGIGIADEDKKHLFERFFRGQNATNIQGTGLGLNIVVKYVEMIGGSITFESELDKGTEFKILLPVTTDNGEEPVSKNK
jgi:signal transduction histidine kinase